MFLERNSICVYLSKILCFIFWSIYLKLFSYHIFSTQCIRYTWMYNKTNSIIKATLTKFILTNLCYNVSNKINFLFRMMFSKEKHEECGSYETHSCQGVIYFPTTWPSVFAVCEQSVIPSDWRDARGLQHTARRICQRRQLRQCRKQTRRRRIASLAFVKNHCFLPRAKVHAKFAKSRALRHLWLCGV